MHDRCTANDRPLLVRHRPCFFSIIALSSPGECHLPDPGTVTARVRPATSPGLSPGPRTGLGDRFCPCGFASPSLGPTHRLHRWQPHVVTGCCLPLAVPASQQQLRAETAPPLSSLVHPSVRWGAASSRNQSDSLPIYSPAPEYSGSAFNCSLVSRGLLKEAREAGPVER